MSNGSKSIGVLEEQITALSDARNNLGGLIEKTVRIQTDLMNANLMEFSEALGDPFSALSTAGEHFQDLFEKMEAEKNRIRSEEAKTEE